jgi:hypothetical protein
MPDDAAGLDQIAAVGDVQALHGVLLDQQNSNTGLAYTRERVEQFAAQQRRKAKRRLVEQQQLRRGHQRAADRHHLLLAAAHRAGELAAAFGEPRKQRHHAVEVFALGGAGALRIGAELEILAHGQFGENAAPLRHQRDAGLDDLMRRQCEQVLPVEADARAVLRSHQACDGLEQRRLAGAVRAEHHDNLARLHVEIDAGERLMLAVAGGERANLKHRRLRGRRARLPSRRARPRAALRRSCGRRSSRCSGRTASGSHPSRARPG